MQRGNAEEEEEEEEEEKEGKICVSWWALYRRWAEWICM
jgi:hypothetical protein